MKRCLTRKTLFFTTLVLAYVNINLNAATVSYVQVKPFKNNHFDFGTWDPSQGDVFKQKTRCVASANDNQKNPAPGALNFNYQFSVSATNGFYVYLNGDNSLTGDDERLPITIQHKDTRENTNRETLSNGAEDTHSHSGQFKNCKADPNPALYPKGNNSQVRVSIAENDIYELKAGDYSEALTASVRGGSDTITTASSATINPTITIPEMIKISGLDTINLPNWTGSGPLSAESEFCVFSNTPTYSVTLSTTNTSGNLFRLKENSSTEFINYTVMFDDDLDASDSGALSSGVLSSGYLGDLGLNIKDCTSGENASIYIEVTDSDLRSAFSGTYSDILTIVVEPN